MVWLTKGQKTYIPWRLSIPEAVKAASRTDQIGPALRDSKHVPYIDYDDGPCSISLVMKVVYFGIEEESMYNPRGCPSLIT